LFERARERMSDTNGKTGMFVGLNHGHVVPRPKKQEWKKRPCLRKGKISARCKMVRAVIAEVAGFSPLEKKMIELIRTGVATKEKKAGKLAKAKLGTHRRAMQKKE
tara:strand:- start:476 stop:793 length:318 start_codon:yes stop_codon:yes gene_type:complete